MDVTIEFGTGNSVNTSAQVGDIAYYVQVTDDSGFTVNMWNATTIGPIISFPTNGTSIVCSMNTESENPIPENAFIFIAKDNIANASSLLGYYGSARFKNNSASYAELFSTSCVIAESSK